jgi:hypothetical protein
MIKMVGLHLNVIKLVCSSGRRFMQGSIDGRDRLSDRLCRSSHWSSALSSILWPRSKFYDIPGLHQLFIMLT